MRFDPITMTDRTGRTVLLRSADISDGEALVRYLRETSAETPFLLREPDEVTLTPAQEESFIQSRIDAPRELMLLAEADGELAGCGSLMSMGPFRRYAHRCEVALALYRRYCGAGIGKMLLETLLNEAKALGYEQAELEVMAQNRAAVALYEKLGFTRCGVLPNNMKYAPDRYDDAYRMVKPLR